LWKINSWSGGCGGKTMPPLQGWMGGWGEILFFYNHVTPSGFLIYALSTICRERKILSFGFYNQVIPSGFLILACLPFGGKEKS
jgi:hypothetical protein